MDKELISVGRWSVVLFNDIVDVLKICVRVDQNGRNKEGRTVTAELTKRAKMKATTGIEKSRKINKESSYQGCNEK